MVNIVWSRQKLERYIYKKPCTRDFNRGKNPMLFVCIFISKSQINLKLTFLASGLSLNASTNKSLLGNCHRPKREIKPFCKYDGSWLQAVDIVFYIFYEDTDNYFWLNKWFTNHNPLIDCISKKTCTRCYVNTFNGC